MDGFGRVMDHSMRHLAEVERVQPQQIWKFHSISLLTLTQLKLDKNYE